MLDKYNESFLLKCGFGISVAFVCVTIYLCSGFEISFSDILKCKENQSVATAVQADMGTHIIAGDITADTSGKLIINLPGGINETNTTFIKDLLHKKIYISFPKGIKGYDNQNIVNDTDVVANTDIRITETMVNITLSLSSLKDCEVCFDNGQLFINFFVPSESGRAVVVIDAGHGGEDVGAIQKGIYEKDIDLQICNQLKELLDKEDFLVYYTRIDDTYPSVEERVDFANEINADLFISIHSNYYDNSRIHGTSVLYNVKDDRRYNSKWLSEIMCSEVSEASGMYYKGIVEGNDIHIVRHSKVPVALIEMGFMSNEDDFQVLTTETGQKNVAAGIYHGIIRALTELGKY